MVSLLVAFGVAATLFAAEAPPPPPATTHIPLPAPSVFSVVPGGGASPLAVASRGGPPRLIWTGFQMTDGGSRVFVQTTSQVALDVASGKSGLTVTLHNCRIHMRNNSRTLDTRFFTSPVQQIAVHQRHRDVRLDIALNAAVASTPRQETGADGSHFWVIDFAPAENHPAPAEKSASLK